MSAESMIPTCVLGAAPSAAPDPTARALILAFVLGMVVLLLLLLVVMTVVRWWNRRGSADARKGGGETPTSPWVEAGRRVDPEVGGLEDDDTRDLDPPPPDERSN